jgi:hypothetical protein
MIKRVFLIFSIFILNGCWSTYIQPNKLDAAKVRIINDSQDMNIVLLTYENGAKCSGLQFFKIPKDMQYAKANMDSQLKAGGVFSILIDAEKPFTLELDGRMPVSYGATQCMITTTLIPNKSGSYEYHYDYSVESNSCRVYVLSVVNEGERTPVKSPQFVSREAVGSFFNEGNSCK